MGKPPFATSRGQNSQRELHVRKADMGHIGAVWFPIFLSSDKEDACDKGYRSLSWRGGPPIGRRSRIRYAGTARSVARSGAEHLMKVAPQDETMGPGAIHTGRHHGFPDNGPRTCQIQNPLHHRFTAVSSVSNALESSAETSFFGIESQDRSLSKTKGPTLEEKMDKVVICGAARDPSVP